MAFSAQDINFITSGNNSSIRSVSGQLTMLSGATIVDGTINNIYGTSTGISARIYVDTYNNSNKFGSSIRGRRFRGGMNSPSGVLKDDILLQVVGDAFDGNTTMMGRAAILFSASDNFTSGSNGGNHMSFFTPQSGVFAPVERMRITHDGKIGINNLSPSYTLEISGSGNFTQGLFLNGNPVSTGLDISSFATKTSLNLLSGQNIKFSTVLNSGNDVYNINYPSVLGSAPNSVVCELENNIDSIIYHHIISSVNNSGITVKFSDILSNSGYKYHVNVGL